jgi:hypothetical protein
MRLYTPGFPHRRRPRVRWTPAYGPHDRQPTRRITSRQDRSVHPLRARGNEVDDDPAADLQRRRDSSENLPHDESEALSKLKVSLFSLVDHFRSPRARRKLKRTSGRQIMPAAVITGDVVHVDQSIAHERVSDRRRPCLDIWG